MDLLISAIARLFFIAVITVAVHFLCGISWLASVLIATLVAIVGVIFIDLD